MLSGSTLSSSSLILETLDNNADAPSTPPTKKMNDEPAQLKKRRQKDTHSNRRTTFAFDLSGDGLDNHVAMELTNKRKRRLLEAFIGASNQEDKVTQYGSSSSTSSSSSSKQAEFKR